jgi:putative membrane protein insertion efficiency factor
MDASHPDCTHGSKDQRFPLRWRQPVASALRLLVLGYRYSLSMLFGRTCRHLPTCSEYADEALARHGAWAGGWMSFSRIARCNPWGTSGLDFVPAALPQSARWYMPWRYGRWRGTNESPPAKR